MYTLSLDEVQALAQQSAQPSISIFLPTHRTSPDNQQDPIRFKNLLRQAEDTLAARGLKPREIEAITGPANALLEESLFWRYVYDGLAVYIAPGDFHAYRLPFPVEAQVIVAQSYYVKPVLPQFTNNGHYFILAFSQNEVRLLEGTRHSVAEVEMPENVPGSRADTSDGLNRENREIQVRPVGGGASAFFSSGGDEVSNKVRIEQFLNALDMSLRPLFNAYQSPVVLAGVDYLLPIYRGASEYPHVLAEGIRGNPENLTAQELHTRAWPLVEPVFRAKMDELFGQYQQLVISGRATDKVADIVAAAHAGRIDSLVVAVDNVLWGAFDAETGTVTHMAEEQSAEDDMALLDFAAMQTVAKGGKVYGLPQSEMRTASPALAVLRY